ncbi:hypothetical protein Bca4012_083402 [Brassica carinata]|uniref:Uncharacterized protein n=1 Tax=Brassica carinata TaxID=52824 RepID=A0A8X7SKM4_BRACI|nr:hypothetical protein Bca52824_027348 [Brassica carinata]
MTSSPLTPSSSPPNRGGGFTEKTAGGGATWIGGRAQRKLHREGIEVEKKDFVVVSSRWKREKMIRSWPMRKEKEITFECF